MGLVNLIKKEWFLAGMLLAILLAIGLPELGKSAGYLHLEHITGLGVAVVFFLHGLGLSPSAIKSGISNWRLHLFVQLTTFAAYPLLWLLFGPLFVKAMPAALALGFCYLFMLPGTISSSVAMTSIGKGNVPGAIFNASLSSVLGVVLTPLLVQLFMEVQGAELDLLASIRSIAVLLLLPMLLGQMSRPLLLGWSQKHKQVVNKIDKCVILLIVYHAFCDSVANGIWQSFSPLLLASSIALCFLILVVMVALIQWGAKQCQFDFADQVAAVFCGSKKTLAAGVPMANVIFAQDPALGMILLPIMLYHPIQIVYCAVLANRYANQQKAMAL